VKLILDPKVWLCGKKGVVQNGQNKEKNSNPIEKWEVGILQADIIQNILIGTVPQTS
jgi:hypothetical protein